MDAGLYIGSFLFYLCGFLIAESEGSRLYRYRSYYYYDNYDDEYDGSASMIAGIIIGGLIALCILIAVIVIIVHACNCCKTQGVRGHVVRPTQIPAVTTAPMYGTQGDWMYLPTAPPYDSTTKPPQYSNIDLNPPPSYDDISGSAPPTSTNIAGPSSPAPPYSPQNSPAKHS